MENCSQQIGKLSEALSRAQAVMEGALKDSANPFFKSRYADLSSVWHACRKPLTENGLAVIQTVETAGDKICLCTILSHSSGEWIKSSLPIPVVKTDVQALGSAITYCRRYALAAIVGVCPADDDGEAAMQDERKPKEIKKASLQEIIESLQKELTKDKLPLDFLLPYLEESAKKKKQSVTELIGNILHPQLLPIFKEAYSREVAKRVESPAA